MFRMSLIQSPLLAGTPLHTLHFRLIEIRASWRTRPIAHRFVQVLNAWDEYEVDVLRALLHYRPLGGPAISPDAEALDCADESFASERTDPYPANRGSLMYANPSLMDWLRQAMRDPRERQWAFAEVFGIESRLGETDQERLTYETHRSHWCDMRNAILAEQTDVEATLADYFRANAFVLLSVPHLAEQCRTKQLLIV